MRKGPEGKWQGTSVPLDGATLAVMPEYVNAPVNTQSASLNTHTETAIVIMMVPLNFSCWIKNCFAFENSII